jgi:hypothetical protein
VLNPENVLPALLVAQGAIGAADTLINHELIEHLPRRREAQGEIGLHAIREAIYASLFAGLGWLEWHGALAALIAVLVLGEVAITAGDEFIENRIRVLPQNERVLHVFLTLNLGLIIAVLVPTLIEWARQPTAIVTTYQGWTTWILSALAVAGATWSIRDFFAWHRLRQISASALIGGTS